MTSEPPDYGAQLVEQRDHALAEVERLRAELARRDEQIAAVRARLVDLAEALDQKSRDAGCVDDFPCWCDFADQARDIGGMQ
jgi:hypothetical protein